MQYTVFEKHQKSLILFLKKIVFKSFCVKSNVRNHVKKSVLITKPLPFYGSMRQFWQFLNTMTKLETVLIFLSFLFQSMPQCRDLLLHCSWQSQEIDCLRLFKVMTTDDGFCCLFNAYKQGDVMKEMNLTTYVKDLVMSQVTIRPHHISAFCHRDG